MATIGEALVAATSRLQASGSPSPRLDAELLLGQVVGLDRTGVVAHPEVILGPEHAAAFEASLERRAAGEPVAYIRGVKAFYGFALGVDSRALIPRPETELLVELALARVRDALGVRPRPEGSPPFRVLDCGTGSGAIVVAMARTLRRAGYEGAIRFTASDVSEAAISLAIENAVSQGVADLIDFRVADLLSPAIEVDGRPDLVVANLPYVPSGTIDTLGPGIAYEPRLALDGGPDGLDLLRRLMVELPAAIAPGGPAMLEIGSDQAAAVVALAAESLPAWSTRVHADLAGLPRVLELQAPPPADATGAARRVDA